jgi:hypothetical protein
MSTDDNILHWPIWKMAISGILIFMALKSCASRHLGIGAQQEPSRILAPSDTWQHRDREFVFCI